MQKSNPIILLHGALGIAQDVEPIAEHLREKGYETYSFSFSGHGINNVWPDEFRIDLFAKELENFIKNNNLNSVVVFGYSMGGYVALYHKANYPDSPISQIFTYGTKFNWSPATVSKEITMLDPDHLLDKWPHFATLLQDKHGERWKALLRSTAHLMQNLERLDGLTKEDLSDVNIPVVFIRGDQDRVVSSEETLLTASWLLHAQIKTLSHSKHELERSNLKELAEIIHQNFEGPIH